MDRESLKSMLNNLINDKPEEATLDFHNYITTKMKEVTGLAAQPAAEPEVEVETTDTDEE